MTITSEQVQRFTRYAIYLLASYLAKWGIPGVSDSTLEATLPIILTLVGIAWSMYGNRINAKLAEIAKYAKDPNTPVVGIVTTPNQEGRALATQIEGPVAPAGSLEAKNIATTY